MEANYCTHCGAKFPSEIWPRYCNGCATTTFKNPLPVVVAIIPLKGGGYLGIRRNSNPGKGELAFPGGFVEMKEEWDDAASRELFEETGVDIGAENFDILAVRTSAKHILIFAQALLELELPENFKPNDEVLELVRLQDAVNLAFPLHTEMLAELIRDEGLPW